MKPIVKKLKQIFGVGTEENEVKSPVSKDTPLAFSKDELIGVISSIFVPDKNATRINMDSVSSAMDLVHDDMISRFSDNDSLTAVAPEIEHASAILIPSILAPNDFMIDSFHMTIVGTDEDPETITDILKYLNELYGDKYGLADKLDSWLHDIIFRRGGKPIMILPDGVLNRMRDSSITIKEQPLASVSSSVVANETLSCISDLPKEYSRPTDMTRLTELLSAKFSDLVDYTDDISILGNTSIIRETDDRLVNSIEGIDVSTFMNVNTTDIKFEPSPFVDFSDLSGDSNLSSFVELPMESVIPIILDGIPSNHLGYFVLLNSTGRPLCLSDSQANSHANDGNIRKMFEAVYKRTISIEQDKPNEVNSKILSTICNSMIENAMKDKGEELSGNMEIDVSVTQDISTIMLYRLLAGKRTKIMFVPKTLLHYFAFWHNDNGTGKSKLDNIKFPLSLKMTFIITRLLALAEASVNRQELNITFDDKVQNPLELMRTIKKEFMKKRQFGITYDPVSIISSIQDKQLSIIPSQIPGVADFSIESNSNPTDYPTPDDSLLEEINNMYLLSLDVPPSALNRLSEDEFSSSVVINDIFMSNKVRLYQKKLKRFMSNMLRTHATFSNDVQDRIREILTGANATTTTKDSANIDARLNTVIKGIRFTLPAPNISNIKAQAEEIEHYISTIETIIEQIYPDDMVDRDDEDAIKIVRSTIKRDLIVKYINDNNVFPDMDFPSMVDMNISSIADVQLATKNIAAMLIKMKEVTEAEGGDERGY